MALTSAERKRRYREKQKRENNEEYKLKEQLKNKKYYANKIKHEEIKEDDELIVNNKNENEKEIEFIYLEPIKKRINPINKSKLNNKTIEIYLKTMKKIYYNHINSELKDDTEILNVLNNRPYNIDKINEDFGFIKKDIYEIIKKNKKEDIRNLYSVITRIKSYANTVKQLYPYILKNQIIYNEQRMNKKVNKSIEEKIKIVSFEKEDIIKKIKEHSELTSNEILIYSLLTLFPTRRAVDYRKMLISFTEPSSKESNYNYYYNGKFYFNKTKNKKVQKYKISDELDKIIRENIDGREELEYIIRKEGGEGYNQSELSKEIMRIFYKMYGKSLTALEIRRLYATYLKELYDNKVISEMEHRQISDMMNHNYEEKKKYSYI